MAQVDFAASPEDLTALPRTWGNFELNAMRPIIINNVLHSAQILGDAAEKLCEFGVDGTKLDREKVEDYVGRSLMLVTALSPHIGYDKASQIAHKADDAGSALREAAVALGVSPADSDRIVVCVVTTRPRSTSTPTRANSWTPNPP